MKTCTGCSAEKSETDFGPLAGCRDGLNPRCRACASKRTRDWKRLNRDRLASHRRDVYREMTAPVVLARARERAAAAPFKARAGVMRSGIVSRCKKAGFQPPAWLTAERISDWLRSQPNCACCGVAFRIEIYQGQVDDRSPSLDRFDTRRGYEVGNVELICWRCNNIKRNYAASDLMRVAAWMIARTPLEEIAAQPVPQSLFPEAAE